MAYDRDDDEDRVKRNRLRERNRERDRERNEEQSQTAKSPVLVKGSPDTVMEELRLVDLMIDQVHNLYQMFFSGVERLPPLEKQKILEKTIENLKLKISQTPAGRFRYNTVQARFLSYKDRWNKLIKDLESGALKRTIKPR